MIIWILNHYAISPRSIGGTRHFDLAQELVKKGHTVKIFASSFNHLERKETVTYTRKKSKEETIDNVSFIWIKTPPYHNSLKRLVNISVFSLRLNNVLNKYLKKETPDLIIGSSVHPLTPLIGLRKAKNVNSLFYFEERDLWPQTFIDFEVLSEKNIVTNILFRIEKHLYKKSDRVIFLFERAHEYAYTKGLEGHKHIYLPNGFNADRVDSKNTSKEVEEILSLSKNKKLCMYVGSMGVANNMMPLLKLAESMREEDNYHFLFIGNGPLKPSFIKFKDNGKLTNISFHDPISKNQIPYLLSHAHCGLISLKDSPLYNWGFSMNKIYDYLSLGLPIIMYSNLEDIGNLENSRGIFNSNSIEFLKDTLLANFKTDREEIRKFALDHYSWGLLAESLLLEVEKNRKTLK